MAAPKGMRRKKMEGLTDQLDGEYKLEDMIKSGKNKYLLVNLLARRARDLNEGSRPLVRLEGNPTKLDIAVAEAHAGKLNIEKKEKERVIVDLVETA